MTTSTEHEPAAATRWLAFVPAAVIGLVGRWWLIAGHQPRWWRDSHDYLAVGRHRLLSSELWLGARPPLVPLLLAATGGHPGHRFMVLQVVVAALAWAWLASELVVRARCTAVGCGLAVALVGFSLAWPVTLWDRSVLTESVSLSLLAVVTASGLRFADRPRRWSGAVLVCSCLAWSLARDSVAPALVAGALVVACIQLCRRREVVVLVVAGLILCTGGAVAGAATYSHRDRVPTAHVYFARMLPHPDRIDWLAAHGMPQAGLLRTRALAAEGSAGHPPAVVLDRHDPTLAPWWTWLRRRGASTFRRYVATHPWYLVAEPAHRPERAYDTSGGHLAGYRAAGAIDLPIPGSLLWPSIPATLLGLGILAGHRWRSSRPPNAALRTAGVLLVASSAYALVAWHSDGIETTRHVFLAQVMVRLALLLALGSAVDDLVERRPG